MKQKAEKPVLEARFVVCPLDGTRSYAMHPGIYWECKGCGENSVTAKRTHAIAVIKYDRLPRESVSDAFNRVVDHFHRGKGEIAEAVYKARPS